MISDYWSDSCSTTDLYCMQPALLQFASGWCCRSLPTTSPVRAECGSPSDLWGSMSWPHHPSSWNLYWSVTGLEEDYIQDGSTEVELPSQCSPSLPGWPLASAQTQMNHSPIQTYRKTVLTVLMIHRQLDDPWLLKWLVQSASSSVLLVPFIQKTISRQSFAINKLTTWD